MDKTDIKIINLLQEDGRMSIKDIASQVNLTSPAVSERIRRLEDGGIIEGYHAEINPLKTGKSIIAFVSVDVNPKLREGFVEFCENNKHIKEHYHIIGPYNALLKVVAEGSDELTALLGNIQVFGVTQTSIVLESVFKFKAE